MVAVAVDAGWGEDVDEDWMVLSNRRKLPPMIFWMSPGV